MSHRARSYSLDMNSKRHFKNRIAFNSFNKTTVTPEISVVSESEANVKTKTTGPEDIAARVSKGFNISKKVARIKRFVARSRSKKDNLSISVFSLHGYSSLQMARDGHKACGKKVGQWSFTVT